MTIRKSGLALCSLLLIGFAPSPAFAYLDPGTGGMILQILLGGVAGVLVIGKLYWHKILRLFGLRRETGPTDASSRNR